MKIVGSTLEYLGGSVKARSGSTTGTNLITVNPTSSKMTIDGQQYPLMPTNDFTAEPNGTLGQRNGRIVIAYAYMWWTPNVISVLVNQISTAGQQAAFTVQHGTQSRIFLSTDTQEQSFLHDPAAPLVITAFNLSTGAVGSASIVASSIPAGQAYVVSSNSVTTQVGELKTVGGELISGGELKNVCVREEYNIANAPTVTAKGGTINTASTNLGVSSSTSAGVYAAYNTEYMNVVQGIQYMSSDSGTQYTMSDALQRTANYSNVPLALVGPNNNISLGINIKQGQPFTVPTTQQYTLWINPPQLIVAGQESFPARPLNDIAPFPLTAGETYIANWEMNSTGLQVSSTTPVQSGANYSGTFNTVIRLAYNIIILGPLTTYCATYQTIDTRYSYTTPVVTTDTRRNVYTITVYTSPIN